jgi:hypothetical protein
MLALTVAAPLAFVSCDRTVSETSKTTETPNGTVKTDSKTVTQDNNGGVTVTKEKSVSNP